MTEVRRVAGDETGLVEPTGVPAREVALRMLEALFGSDGPAMSRESRSVALAAFQRVGLARVGEILRNRGGAILADSVGLGKTHVAAGLVEERLAAGATAVVVVPAATRPQWRRILEELPDGAGGWRLLSHARLSRGVEAGTVPGPGHGQLIVVDEAHRFRNPRTLRYAALARMAASGADLLLITATPMNNRPEDLLHLLRLFAADDAFVDVGVASLREAFRRAGDQGEGNRGGESGREADIVLREVLVRRTRSDIHTRFPTADSFAFPDRAPPRTIRYSDTSISAMVKRLAALELPVHEGSAGGLVRLGLLKRLDSSPGAFHRSVERLEEFTRRALDAAVAGFVLHPGTARTRTGDSDPLQLTLLELSAEPAPPGVDVESLERALERDARRLRRLLERHLSAPSRDGTGDPKLTALRRLLGELPGEKVVIFTEFRDTAEDLWRALSKEHRVGRVDGGDARLGIHPAGRRAVIERFAPRANGAGEPSAHERVDILVATDVLAQGLNLQDAGNVISYDLPWNPVVLLQRIGRVDRMGSAHSLVVPYLFVPSQGLEEMLGLLRRIRSKLGRIEALVGSEGLEELLDGLSRGDELAARAPAASTLAPTFGSAKMAGRAADGGVRRPRERLQTLWSVLGPNERSPGGGLAQESAPIAQVAIPPSHAAASVDWLVLVRLGSETLLLEVGRDGRAAEASEAGVAVIESAFRNDSAGDPTELVVSRDCWLGYSSLPRSALRQFVQERSARTAAPLRIRPHEAAYRLSRLVRATIARAGTTVDAAALARGDRLLTRLARPLGPVADAAVEALLRHLDEERKERSARDRPEGLLTAVEAALDGGTRDLADDMRQEEEEAFGHGCRQRSGQRSLRVIAALKIHLVEGALTG